MVRAALEAARRLLRHRASQVGLSLGLGGLLLWLAIARINLAGLGAQMAQIRPSWLALAILAYWGALMLRSWRWGILLAPVRRLRFGQIFFSLLVGYAANNVLPARLGELLRADFLGRRYGVSRLSVVGTIVVERLFDVVVFIGFFFAGTAALHDARDSRVAPILRTVELVTVGCVVLILVLLVLLRLRHKPFPAAISFLEQRLKLLAQGLHLITGVQEIALLSAATLVVWTADTLAIWLLARALGIDLTPLPMLFVMGISCLAALIPAAPGNIGAQQYALVLAFELLGLSGVGGFGLATLAQGCFLAGSTLVGGSLYLLASFSAGAPKPASRGPG